MRKGEIDVISMGCSKNLIDSERLLRKLTDKGYKVNHDPDMPSGEWVVVNTCGFIQDAKEESIDIILELGKLKNNRKIGKIVVMGCLSQRYMDELKIEMPEVDIWYGKYDWKSFIDTLPNLRHQVILTKDWERILTTPSFSAYLKISEGCNRFCAFCAIPIITGRHSSRPIEEILEEVRDLVSKGVKEFNVIAQDLSSYGTDLYGRHALAELIDKMAEVKGVEWIRLHYAYPSDFPMDILDVMARRDNVCKYIDIALQHIADPVLENMRRNIDAGKTRKLLAEMRERVQGLKIRTTLMVGFPGEGEDEFRQLIEFVRGERFERMGAFAYSEEDDTWAAKNLVDDIPEDVKQQRLDTLMSIQEDISLKRNEEMIGQTVKVLVERLEGDTRIGRTQWDSPEVDPEVYVSGSDAEPGDFINVKITGAEPFELFGELV